MFGCCSRLLQLVVASVWWVLLGGASSGRWSARVEVSQSLVWLAAPDYVSM